MSLRVLRPWGACRSNLAVSVQSMQSLESLTILFCPQIERLQLSCSHLTRLALKGNRNLQEVGACLLHVVGVL